MAQYQARVDVHTLTPEQRAALQPGQHITASGAPGRWAGQTRHGTDVAAWAGNATRHPLGRAGYFRAMREYATR
ncbi:hypothetical protein DSS3P8_005 [Roseobacter phage DSS3P8]|nr:hypothetical protein DSS3P8_005 [Roseobacter phage DSS3P8]